jgi:hypothetical protein
MWHTIGWLESVNCNSAYTNIAALTDPTIHKEGDYNYIPKGLNQCIWAYAAGINLLNMKLNSPSLRAMFPHYISPMTNLGQMYKEPSVQLMLDSPLPLVETEGVEALAYTMENASRVHGCYLGLNSGPVVPVKGKMYTIHFTLDITGVLTQWVNSVITFTETLPAGRYQVVGAAVWALSGMCFRIFFPGQVRRPGAPVMHDSLFDMPKAFRQGAMGVWGEFDHDVPPTIEMNCETTDAQDADGYFDLIKIA